MTNTDKAEETIQDVLEELMLDVLQEASKVAGKDIYITTFPEEPHKKRLTQLLNSEVEKAVVAARKEGYDPNRLGSWIFIGDKARLDNLDDLYWSYVTEYMAKQDPYRPDSVYGKTDYLKKNMPYAGFNKVGIHAHLARADQYAKERLAQLNQGEKE